VKTSIFQWYRLSSEDDSGKRPAERPVIDGKVNEFGADFLSQSKKINKTSYPPIKNCHIQRDAQFCESFCIFTVYKY
jgi:hypothetical protein